LAYRDNHNRPSSRGSEATFDRFDPLLVNLHDSVSAYKTDRRNSDCSQDLINNVAAILDANLSESEGNLAADILISLIKQAEKDIRKNLADRLAPRDDLHATLLHYLAYDDIDVAQPVLKFSPLLKDMDILLIIQSKGSEHWQAVADRADISDRVVDLLVAQQDMKTSTCLLRNETIDMDERHLEKIKGQAICDETLADELLNYKTLPRQLAVEIYWHVSIALRNDIANRFDIANNEVNRALEDCVQDFSDTMLQDNARDPSTLMNEVAGLYFAQDKISEHRLVNTLRRRQGRFFIALFSMKSGLKNEIVWNMMRQVGGQGLAVACRAMAISKENFVSMFLLSRTIARSHQAVNADELRMAMRYYDSLTFKTAKDILKDSIA
jgi:uncharacterized protein (DUF2336 family)